MYKLFITLQLLYSLAYAKNVYIESNHTKNAISSTKMQSKNLVMQKFDYTCACASLSTVFTYYYDLNITEKDILNAMLASRGIDIDKKYALENTSMAFTFFDLANYAKSKGFKAKGMALNMHALSKLKIPVILYVKIDEQEHFTVYKSMDKEYVYLADPSLGNIKVKKDAFRKMFYHRKDLEHRGKILAIMPQDINKTLKRNGYFMKIEH